MASKLFMKGKQLSGSVANALKINCKDKDGNKSTVQAELNKLNNEISEQDKNMGGLRFGVDGEGNGGYFKADDSFIPFKRSNGDILHFNIQSDGAASFVITEEVVKKYSKLIAILAVGSGTSGNILPSFSSDNSNVIITTLIEKVLSQSGARINTNVYEITNLITGTTLTFGSNWRWTTTIIGC